MKLDILIFGAHPDDVELSCAGTIMATIQSDEKVGIVDLTEGELGTRGNALIRKQEAMKATKLLGVFVRENLKLADGFFEINKKTIYKVIQVIRKYQPEIIIANAPEDRHPDHGRAAKLIYESFFLSGLEKIKTNLKNVQQKPWKPSYLFNYIQDKYIEPDFLVDISPFMENKLKAIEAYTSQFFSKKTQFSQESETYISTPQFLESIINRNKLFGKRIGVPYAEGFLTQKQLGIQNFKHIIKNKT